jgi:hypothetical protein
MVVVAAAAAANGSRGTEKRNCEEQASERACGWGWDMSALQIAATQRVCRGLVSLPSDTTGKLSVSVSAAGRIVSFFGEFLVVAKMAIIHTKLECFFVFLAEFLFVAKTGDHIHTKHL